MSQQHGAVTAAPVMPPGGNEQSLQTFNLHIYIDPLSHVWFGYISMETT